MKKSPSGIAPVIAIRRNAKTPIHRQIYEAYRAAIIAGNLRPGQRVPSTRTLAGELGVSRFPVLNAHAQLLAEGYLISRVGAGTVVSDVLPDHHGPSKLPVARQSAARRSRSRQVSQRSKALPSLDNTEWVGGWGAFGVGQVAVEHFPMRLWSSLVNRCWRRMNPRALHYGDAMGSARLREVIANYLNTARSLRCHAGQVMIVTGSQQALELSARILLDPGDSVWMEEPGYRLARDAFSIAGLRVVPVPVDEEGLDVGAGIRLARKAKAVYVTPSHQFPLGYTMSAARRLSLLDWAQRNGSWIIEDDYDSEFRYESPPVAAMQGIDTDGRVVYIGTFSKVLFPSLRIGYLVIPADLVERFRAMRRVMDLAPAGPFQEVLADFIDEGHFERHIRRMRTIYRERSQALVRSLHSEMGSMVDVLGSDAGLHLTVTLRERVLDTAIARRAAQQNLRLWPLSPAYLGKAPHPGFVLGFGSIAPDKIPAAVRRIRALLDEA